MKISCLLKKTLVSKTQTWFNQMKTKMRLEVSLEWPCLLLLTLHQALTLFNLTLTTSSLISSPLFKSTIKRTNKGNYNNSQRSTLAGPTWLVWRTSITKWQLKQCLKIRLLKQREKGRTSSTILTQALWKMLVTTLWKVSIEDLVMSISTKISLRAFPHLSIEHKRLGKVTKLKAL